jgi:hypothetical protein
VTGEVEEWPDRMARQLGELYQVEGLGGGEWAVFCPLKLPNGRTISLVVRELESGEVEVSEDGKVISLVESRAFHGNLALCWQKWAWLLDSAMLTHTCVHSGREKKRFLARVDAEDAARAVLEVAQVCLKVTQVMECVSECPSYREAHHQRRT